MLSYPDISGLSFFSDKISNMLCKFKLLITQKSNSGLYQLLSDSAIIILIINFFSEMTAAIMVGGLSIYELLQEHLSTFYFRIPGDFG
jgi:hypothetical protein